LGAIYGDLAKVMQELSAIGKDRKNEKQGFMFRGIDQVYNALHPLMAKYGIFTVPKVLEVVSRENRPTRSGGISTYTLLRVQYAFVSGKDGSHITVGPVIGEAMDSGDKGCNKCLAIAHKYALFQLFMIPTEDSVDPDFQTHETVQEPAQFPDTRMPGPVTAPSQRFMPQPITSAPQVHLAPTPVPQPVVQAQPTAAAGDFSGSSVDLLTINNPEEARNVTDLLISLAMSTHGGTKQELATFWKMNIKPIDYLDTHYNDEYQRLKTAFTQIKAAIQQEQPA
jgi:hypothetical protein